MFRQSHLVPSMHGQNQQQSGGQLEEPPLGDSKIVSHLGCSVRLVIIPAGFAVSKKARGFEHPQVG